MSFNVAIYGYDTDIGKLILETLEDSSLHIDELFPLSPLPGEYDAVKLKGKNHLISYVDEFDFSRAQVAFFITTRDESLRLCDKARQAGCIVIDDSRLYTAQKDVPVVLPELNPQDIVHAIEHKLVVPASSVTTELALPLAALHDEFGVDKAVVTSLESVSEFGRSGTETLARETALLLNGMPLEANDFPAQLAFNVHTRVGELTEEGSSEREAAVIHELSRIMGDFKYGVALTSLQVPVFYGHTLVVHVELEEDASLEEVADCLNNAEGISVTAKEELITPVTHGVKDNTIYISRLRKESKAKKSFDFAVVMDNTRRGEAVNCVSIASLIKKQMGL